MHRNRGLVGLNYRYELIWLGSQIAFDITDGNPQALMLKLETIDVTRKQLIELRHVFNGQGFQTQRAAADEGEQRAPPGLTEEVAGLRDYGPGADQCRCQRRSAGP